MHSLQHNSYHFQVAIDMMCCDCDVTQCTPETLPLAIIANSVTPILCGGMGQNYCGKLVNPGHFDTNHIVYKYIFPNSKEIYVKYCQMVIKKYYKNGLWLSSLT